MFSHVTLGTNDLARARAFYDAVLPVIGWHLHYDESAHGLYGYAPQKDTVPQFWIRRPLDGKPATVGNGVTVAFNVNERRLVHAAMPRR